jgi:hypothetical protein
VRVRLWPIGACKKGQSATQSGPSWGAETGQKQSLLLVRLISLAEQEFAYVPNRSPNVVDELLSLPQWRVFFIDVRELDRVCYL